MPPASLTRIALGLTALGLTCLPGLLMLPVDLDKVAHLILLPAIICSLFTPGWASLSRPARHTVIALTVIVLLSTALSPFPAPALVTLAGWTLLGFGLFALHRFTATPDALPWILRAIALGCVVGFVLVGILITTGQAGQKMPCYQHPRLFGMHMFAGVLATLALLVSPPRPSRSYGFDIGLAVLCWTAFFWSGSRAPLLGLAAGICVWTVAADAVTRKRLVIIVPLLVLLALGLSHLIRYPAYSLGWSRAVERSVQASDINGLSSSRLVLWDKTWKQATDNFWLGRGPDGYRYLRPKLDGEQPHNFLLHWRLELGWPGLICLLGLLGLCITTGLRNRDPAYRRWAVAGASSLVACTATAFLDGVFYHVFILLPVICLSAACLQSPPATVASSVSTRSQRWLTGAAASLATSILVLHSILLYHLVRGIPPHPQAPIAQMLRAFPSTTNGLVRWIGAWRPSLPDVALEWTLWAQNVAAYPAIYHEQAARMYITRDDLAAAEVEFQAALATAHQTARPQFEKLLQLTRNARHEVLTAQKNGQQSTPQPAP